MTRYSVERYDHDTFVVTGADGEFAVCATYENETHSAEWRASRICAALNLLAQQIQQQRHDLAEQLFTRPLPTGDTAAFCLVARDMVQEG